MSLVHPSGHVSSCAIAPITVTVAANRLWSPISGGFHYFPLAQSDSHAWKPLSKFGCGGQGLASLDQDCLRKSASTQLKWARALADDDNLLT
jgi:hypothetical protein